VVVLWWYAFSVFQGLHRPGLSVLHTACGLSLALWAAFLVADEIFLAYDAEATHMRIFSAQLLSLLVFHGLPDGL
jgi:hypothetical protein